MTWPEDDLAAGTADEELHQPRRRVPTAVLPVTAAAVVGVGVLVAVSRGEQGTPTPSPSPPPPPVTTAAAPTPTGVLMDFGPPDALVRAVTTAYPGADLVEMGVTVPGSPDADRNYQFVVGGRRITVLVGPADSRPAVETMSTRDVLVVAKPSGHRVAVSVRTFRGALRPRDLVLARRLALDTRLLTSP